MTGIRMEVTENRRVAPDIYRLALAGEMGHIPGPGQFVNLSVPGFFLRRPFSVQDAEKDRLTLFYKVVGRGTAQMTQLKKGDVADLLSPLGRGFSTKEAGVRPLLAGGGLGIAPLYYLARVLVAEGRTPTVLCGYRTGQEDFLEDAYRALGCTLHVTTEDGSRGIRGFVTDALPDDYTYLYTCGPLPMMRALYRAVVTDGQFLTEERMGCGYGACMGCSVRTKGGYRRVCKEGPVFTKEELLWGD